MYKLFFIIVCFSFAQAKINQGEQEWLDTLQTCLKRHDLTESAFFKGEVPDEKKCFHKCLSEVMGLMNNKDEFIIEEYKAQRPYLPKYVVENMDTCAPKVILEDICETSKIFSDCMREKFEAQKKAEKLNAQSNTL